MNLLSLKAVTFEPGQGFHSPQHKSFYWPTGIVVAACKKCPEKEFNPSCTCGIHSSPNPEFLVDYAVAKNSVFVLLHLYGWNDIYQGPRDFPDCHVVRSWGAKIIGIVGSTATRHPMALSPQRQLSAAKGSEFYEVEIYPWEMAKTMIQITWKQWSRIVKDPYGGQNASG